MKQKNFTQYKRKKDTLGRPEEVKPVLERYLRKWGKPGNALIIELWQHWHMVMGDEIASIANPLGYDGGILLIGAEDAMSAQDLSYMTYEILERANAFMEREFFKTVRVSLNLGQTALSEAVKFQGMNYTPPKAPAPKLNGKYLQNMTNDSAVARCYARYVEWAKGN